MVKSDNKDLYIDCLGEIRGCLVAHCDCAKLCNEMTLAREETECTMNMVGLRIVTTSNPTTPQPIDRERRASRAIGRERDPRVQEIVGEVPEHERGGLP